MHRSRETVSQGKAATPSGARRSRSARGRRIPSRWCQARWRRTRNEGVLRGPGGSEAAAWHSAHELPHLGAREGEGRIRAAHACGRKSVSKAWATKVLRACGRGGGHLPTGRWMATSGTRRRSLLLAQRTTCRATPARTLPPGGANRQRTHHTDDAVARG